jgi:hypothetical protein
MFKKHFRIFILLIILNLNLFYVKSCVITSPMQQKIVSCQQPEKLNFIIDEFQHNCPMGEPNGVSLGVSLIKFKFRHSFVTDDGREIPMGILRSGSCDDQGFCDDAGREVQYRYTQFKIGNTEYISHRRNVYGTIKIIYGNGSTLVSDEKLLYQVVLNGDCKQPSGQTPSTTIQTPSTTIQTPSTTKPPSPRTTPPEESEEKPSQCSCNPAKSFFDGNNYYVFYTDCNRLVYKFSPDGVEWSKEKYITNSSNRVFDLYYKNGKVYLSYVNIIGRLDFMEGTIEEDEIVWSEPQKVDQINFPNYVKIVVDENEKPWIVALVYNRDTEKYEQRLYFGREPNKWETVQLKNVYGYPLITPLPEGKVMVLYFEGKTTSLKEIIFDGNDSPLKGQQNTKTDLLLGDKLSFLGSISLSSDDNGNVHLTWLNSKREVRFRQKDESGWSKVYILTKNADKNSYPNVVASENPIVSFVSQPNKIKVYEKESSWSGKELEVKLNKPYKETFRTSNRADDGVITQAWCEASKASGVKSFRPFVTRFGQKIYTDQLLRFNVYYLQQPEEESEEMGVSGFLVKVLSMIF